MSAITQHITQIFRQYTTGYVRAVVFGASLAYAIPNEFWHHVPLIFLNPMAYASYQIYVSKPDVIKWCKQTVKELR